MIIRVRVVLKVLPTTVLFRSTLTGMVTLYEVKIYIFKFCKVYVNDEVAEWLRRWTANPMCSARVGSNPILVDIFFFLFLA